MTDVGFVFLFFFFLFYPIISLGHKMFDLFILIVILFVFCSRPIFHSEDISLHLVVQKYY